MSKPVFDFSGPEGNVFNILALLDNLGETPSEHRLREMQYAGICLHFIRTFRSTFDFVNIPDDVYEEADHNGNAITY